MLMLCFSKIEISKYLKVNFDYEKDLRSFNDFFISLNIKS